MITIKDNEIRFSSGKVVGFYGGIVGLSSTISDRVYGGYDDPIRISKEGDDYDITPDEAAELAEYMISLWTKFLENQRVQCGAPMGA